MAHAGGNRDVALVPGDAEVVLDRLREVGDLDVAGLGVGGILRELVPGHVARKGGDEFGFGGDVVAEALGLEDAGEGDVGGGGEVLGEPGLVDADVVAVEREAPLAGEGFDAGGWGDGWGRGGVEDGVLRGADGGSGGG